MKRPIRTLILSAMLLSACAVHRQRLEADAVVLVLNQPTAGQVTLHCSLDGFAPRAARKVAAAWEVSLPAHRPFAYFYRVDGNLFLPDCAVREKDDFGSENCLFDPRP